jgi:hypothetical protein
VALLYVLDFANSVSYSCPGPAFVFNLTGQVNDLLLKACLKDATAAQPCLRRSGHEQLATGPT